MQDLAGTDAYFQRQNLVVVDLLEVDISNDDSGNWQTVQDLLNTNINQNKGKSPTSLTFDCANYDKQYCRTKDDSPYYEWVIKGKRVRFAMGLRLDDDSDQTWQWFIGRIVDRYVTSGGGGSSILHVVAADFLKVFVDKYYITDTHWGSTITFDQNFGQQFFSLAAATDISGVYKVELPTGTELDDKDWSYDHDRNGLVLSTSAISLATGNFQGYWKGEDWTDSSGNGNTAAWTQSAIVAGQVDDCMKFYLDLPGPIHLEGYAQCGTDDSLKFISGDISLETWTTGNSGQLLSRDGAGDDVNYRWYFVANKLRFSYRNAADDAYHVWESTNAFAGGWKHFALVFTFADGDSIEAYKDGVLEAGSWIIGDGSENPYTGGTQQLMLATKDNGVYNDRLDAKLDEVAIYAYRLLSDQIVYHYNSGTGRHYDELTPDEIKVYYFTPHDPAEVVQDMSDDCGTGTIQYVPADTYRLDFTDGFDGDTPAQVETDPEDAEWYELGRDDESYGSAPLIFDVGAGDNASLVYDPDADGNLLLKSEWDKDKLWQGVAIDPQGDKIQRVRFELRLENSSYENWAAAWSENFAAPVATFTIGAGNAAPWNYDAGNTRVLCYADPNKTKLWEAMEIPDTDSDDYQVDFTLTNLGMAGDWETNNNSSLVYNFTEAYAIAPAWFKFGFQDPLGYPNWAVEVAGGFLKLYHLIAYLDYEDRGWQGHEISYDAVDATCDNTVTFTFWVSARVNTSTKRAFVGITTDTPDAWDDASDPLPNKDFVGFCFEGVASNVEFWAGGAKIGDTEDFTGDTRACVSYNPSTGAVLGFISGGSAVTSWSTTISSGLSFIRFGYGFKVGFKLGGRDSETWLSINQFTIHRGKWQLLTKWYLGITPDDIGTLGDWGVPDKSSDFIGVRVEATFSGDDDQRTNPYVDYTYDIQAFAVFNGSDTNIADMVADRVTIDYNQSTGDTEVRWSATAGDFKSGVCTTGKRYTRGGFGTGGDVTGTNSDMTTQIQQGIEQVDVNQATAYYPVTHYIGITDAVAGVLQAWGKPPAANNFIGLKLVWNNAGAVIDTTPDIYAVFNAVETLIIADYDHAADFTDLNEIEIQYNKTTGLSHVKEMAAEFVTKEATITTAIAFIRLGGGGGGDNDVDPTFVSESSARITNVSDRYYASGTVTSQIVDLTAAVEELGILSWQEDLQEASTDLYFQTRTSADAGMAGAEAWKPIAPGPYLTAPDGSQITSTAARYFQMRATLSSTNQGSTARIKKTSPVFFTLLEHFLNQVYADEGANYFAQLQKICQAINCEAWFRYDGTLMITALPALKEVEDFELTGEIHILSIEDAEEDEEYFDYIQVLGKTLKYETYDDSSVQYTGKKELISATKTGIPAPDEPITKSINNDFIDDATAAQDIADSLYARYHAQSLRVRLNIVHPLPWVIGDTCKITDETICFDDAYMTATERRYLVNDVDISKKIAPNMTIVLVKPSE